MRAPLEFKPPEVFKKDAMDLISMMLKKDPTERLGSGEADGDDIKTHPWFKPIDWAKLQRREILPSFKPAVKSETDTSNFDEEFTTSAIESVVPEGALSKPGKGDEFEGFTYVDNGPLQIS